MAARNREVEVLRVLVRPLCSRGCSSGILWAISILFTLTCPRVWAGSNQYVINASNDHEYGLQTQLPSGFGDGEFTFELWIRPDDSFPVGPTDSGSNQLTNWTATDNEPHSSDSWWFDGNFLLDGHNNGSFQDGTFSLQFYGGGRIRWLFGDGVSAGAGGHWSVGAFPATNTPSLLDGNWHQITLVRRWSGDDDDAKLELWIDGDQVATQTSSERTNMRSYWNSWSGFPNDQEGWFWGSEKQAAIGVLSQYEDYKGLVDEMRFWSRAKSGLEIVLGYNQPVVGDEPGLVGHFSFSEGSGTSTCDALNPGQCVQLIKTDASIWSGQDAPLSGLDPNNVFVDFNAPSGGDGSIGSPFNSLGIAAVVANSGATITIQPGVSSESFTIDKALLLENGNPGGGAVRVGDAGARSPTKRQAQVGFVAAGPK